LSDNKILIIDDSKTFLKFIVDLLGDLPNIKIRLVHDPRLAIISAEEFMPDLILTDFEMPHLNGMEICQQIKKHKTLSIIPIMMLTTNNSEDQLIRAIDFGADDFLFKASKKEVVLIKIKSLLRYKNLVAADSKLKQLEAVNALIATSNHEFNNALFISNGFIRKMKKMVDGVHLDHVLKIEELNQRMESIVKNLENLKEIQLEGYAGEVKMIKF
jgi:DNA-binding response OmpR family regulator